MPGSLILVKNASALHTTTAYLLDMEHDDDPELMYYQAQRIVARNADKWTAKQKANLINAMIINE